MVGSTQASHPGAAQLAAFAQGNLSSSQREAVRAHLNTCAGCRKALAALPADAESVSGEEVRGTTLAPQPGVTVITCQAGDVPADLANHPKLEVLQLLGQGGMGTVYKALHRKMDRVVALKVINAKLLENPLAVDRFQREVKAAAKLEHPNIVRAYDADDAGSTHFLVMEFIEGTDLAKYVEKKGPLPVADACHFICQAALGRQHAHEKGMVHRDIKPHNLMLSSPVASVSGAAASAPVVKIMDFGLARLALESATDAGLTGENALMGSVDYIAPEQAEDAHHADIRADIYGLGCSLYHLLAGRPMLAGANVTQKLSAHLTGKLPLSELPATVPVELRAVLAKMVAKDPGQRHQTPGEVAAALVPFFEKANAVSLSPVLRGERNEGRTAYLTPNGQEAALETAGMKASAATWLQPKTRIRIIGIAVIAVLIGAAVYFLGPSAAREDLPGAIEEGKRLDEELKNEESEQERRQDVADDALANVRRTGPTIANKAYPLAIGGVTYDNANVEGVVKDGGDYIVTVKVNYSNSIGRTYFLDILVRYDSTGTFQSWWLARFNDPFPPTMRGKIFDEWLD
jgi:tRNA A-37 threonylcarbamoyl transferase component Bud32